MYHHLTRVAKTLVFLSVGIDMPTNAGVRSVLVELEVAPFQVAIRGIPRWGVAILGHWEAIQ